MEVGTGAVPMGSISPKQCSSWGPTNLRFMHVLHFARMKIVDILALFVIWPKLKQQGRLVWMRTHCLCLERQRRHSCLQISLTASGDLEGHLARLTQLMTQSVVTGQSLWTFLAFPGLQFVWWRVMLVAHQTTLETSWPTG